MWSFVGNKAISLRGYGTQRERQSGKVLAYVFGSRTDEVFLQLKALLMPFGISRFYTDDWGAYKRHLDALNHEVGKQNTQKIENKHLNLRTRIKRLAKEFYLFFQDNSDA